MLKVHRASLLQLHRSATTATILNNTATNLSLPLLLTTSPLIHHTFSTTHHHPHYEQQKHQRKQRSSFSSSSPNRNSLTNNFNNNNKKHHQKHQQFNEQHQHDQKHQQFNEQQDDHSLDWRSKIRNQLLNNTSNNNNNKNKKTTKKNNKKSSSESNSQTIQSLLKREKYAEAFQVIQQHVNTSNSFELTNELLDELILGLKNNNCLDELSQLLLEYGHALQVIQITRIMTALMKNDRISEALESLNRLIAYNRRNLSEGGEIAVKLDAFVYSVLITGLMKRGECEKAASLFREMDRNVQFTGVKATTEIYNSVIHGLAKNHAHSQSLEFYNEMRERGIEPNSYTFAIMIDVYCEMGARYLNDAINMFQSSFTEENNHAFDVFVFTALTNALGKHRAVDGLERVLLIVQEGKVEMDNVAITCLVNAYIRCNRIDRAREVFDLMDQPTLKSINTLLNGFVKFGMVEQAVRMIQEMPTKYSIEPDVFSYSSVIVGLMNTNNIERADMLYRVMLSSDNEALRPSAYIHCTMINGYFQHHDVVKATQTYQLALAQKVVDVPIYCAYIFGLIDHDRVREAELVLQKMQREVPSKQLEQRVLLQIQQRIMDKKRGRTNGAPQNRRVYNRQ